MNSFSTALGWMKNGALVTRISWEGVFLFLVKEGELVADRTLMVGIMMKGNTVKYGPYVCIKKADNSIIPWTCSNEDMLAEDWTIVDVR